MEGTTHARWQSVAVDDFEEARDAFAGGGSWVPLSHICTHKLDCSSDWTFYRTERKLLYRFPIPCVLTLIACDKSPKD